MTENTKIATCGYCGHRSLFNMKAVQTKSLICAACGAPIEKLAFVSLPQTKIPKEEMPSVTLPQGASSPQPVSKPQIQVRRSAPIPPKHDTRSVKPKRDVQPQKPKGQKYGKRKSSWSDLELPDLDFPDFELKSLKKTAKKHKKKLKKSGSFFKSLTDKVDDVFDLFD